jgi:hypothetical protein
MPDMDPFREDERAIIEHGYNSPFEEVSLNMELNAAGVPVTYPRAIYMTGTRSQLAENIFDVSRFESHAEVHTPDGEPILRRRHDYMILWGYWNGPDELLAVKDENYYDGISALNAYRSGRIDEASYFRVMQQARDLLASVGVEDLNLRGTHLLLSIDQSDRLVMDAQTDLPTVRICNFELLKRTTQIAPRSVWSQE